MSPASGREAKRRDAVERALIHHGIDYSPPGGGRPTWIVNTSTGRKVWSVREVEAYCQGLADHDALPTCKGSVGPCECDADPEHGVGHLSTCPHARPQGTPDTNAALTSASAPRGTTEGPQEVVDQGSRAPYGSCEAVRAMLGERHLSDGITAAARTLAFETRRVPLDSINPVLVAEQIERSRS